MIDNVLIAIAIIAIVGLIIAALYQFINLGKEKQLEVVRQWLLYACIEAEKALGSNTGKIKLRYVYNLFISKFKYLSLVISFEQFSLLVDESLETMREMISSNKSIQDYVNSN